MLPARARGIEYLDDPAVPATVRLRSQRDVVRANTLLGGAHALVMALESLLPRSGGSFTLLDLGTGLGDLPWRAVRRAARRGTSIVAVGYDAAPVLLRSARERLAHAVCGDALTLPFARAGVDFVTCSQLLHHFAHADAVRLVREMHRVARRGVIVSDLRRSRVAMAGFWLASFPLGFHPVTRHDGVQSVRRGFTEPELAAVVREATGREARVASRPGFRLTASLATDA